MRSVNVAQAANDAGADLIGFVFAPSRRQVTADQARDIVDGTNGRAIPVGLFVDDPVDVINASARS
jgi:phosphoribosylanthranilate isomerase